MPKVYNKHHKDIPKDAVYVGRPSRWGNPFSIGKDGAREQVISMYKEHLFEGGDFYELLKDIKRELRGKNLVCWCAPKPCHADILLELAN